MGCVDTMESICLLHHRGSARSSIMVCPRIDCSSNLSIQKEDHTVLLVSIGSQTISPLKLTIYQVPRLSRCRRYSHYHCFRTSHLRHPGELLGLLSPLHPRTDPS